MALFRRNAAVAQPERRAARRYAVDCPARLKMLGGDRMGRLSDLSEAGARLDTPNPPVEGVSGLLEWCGHEHFCKVVWVNDNSCGLIFERPIPLAIVEETSQTVDAPSGPVANFGNIPLGQKRSRRSDFTRSE
ncbi:MAG: PilZ domain-containing protein [Erythrobacter sp.]